jgi:hypothetical protein
VLTYKNAHTFPSVCMTNISTVPVFYCYAKVLIINETHCIAVLLGHISYTHFLTFSW